MRAGVYSGFLAACWLLPSSFACTGSSPSLDTRPLARLSPSLAQPKSVAPRPSPPSPWSEAVRAGRWSEAARLVDALPEAERTKPALRFVRARVARELGDHAAALRLLENLESELPSLSERIRLDRAEAQLQVGPFSEAAAYYARGATAVSWFKAGLAYERAGDSKRARAAADRALALLFKASPKGRAKDAPSELESDVHALRARVAEKQGDLKLAAVELRWLSTIAPTSPHAEHADERLEQLLPGSALSRKERFDRAVCMAREGLVDRTDRELELLEKCHGPPIKQAEIWRTRGFARYVARRDYKVASEYLARAAETSSEQTAKDLFYSARALSRGNEDDRAIGLYQALAARFPGSSWAEDARFLTARLRYIGGRWADAVRDFTRYLSSYPHGRYAEDARYERAVALLAGGESDKAAKAFADLSAPETDSRSRARLFELEGVAWMNAGQNARAIARFEQTIREQPLSFAALASAARLQALAQSAQPLISAAPVSAPAATPLALRMPENAAFFLSLGLDQDAERELVLSESALRQSYGARADEALCQAFGRLTCAAERYRIGQRSARPEALNVAPSQSSRWLWDCVYPRPYASLVAELSASEALSAELLYAIMRQESGFRTGVVSKAGAIGLMQLLENTASKLASELGLPYSPEQLQNPTYNLKLAAHYLHKLLDMFAGNSILAIAAYNAGPETVSRWLESGERLPADVFVARIPYDETRAYVDRVIGNSARYAYLTAGESTVPKLALELPKGVRAPADAY